MIDGKHIAHLIADELHGIVVARAQAPRLAIVVVGHNSVTESFVRTKKRFAERIGVAFEEHRFPDEITEDALIHAIDTITADDIDGLVVQLPLPKHINTPRVLERIPAALDADMLSDAVFDAYVRGEERREPPVAGAVHEVLARSNVTVQNARAVVIGKGRLVGEPVAAYLRNAGAEVFMVDRETPIAMRDEQLKHADIVVSGAGVPNLVTPDLVKDSVVLVDAGTSTAGRTLAGDIALSCESKARVFSQTPGGVGPITVAVLFRNIVRHETHMDNDV